MPSPSIIQDSDDEDGLSPEKLPQIEVAPSDSFFDGIEGLGEPSESQNAIKGKTIVAIAGTLFTTNWLKSSLLTVPSRPRDPAS